MYVIYIKPLITFSYYLYPQYACQKATLILRCTYHENTINMNNIKIEVRIYTSQILIVCFYTLEKEKLQYLEDPMVQYCKDQRL